MRYYYTVDPLNSTLAKLQQCWDSLSDDQIYSIAEAGIESAINSGDTPTPLLIQKKVEKTLEGMGLEDYPIPLMASTVLLFYFENGISEKYFAKDTSAYFTRHFRHLCKEVRGGRKPPA